MWWKIGRREVTCIVSYYRCTRVDRRFHKLIVAFVHQIRSPTDVNLNFVRKCHEQSHEICRLFVVESRQFQYGWSLQYLVILQCN